ncbi:MAG: hypothetical protein R3224_10100, partial [Balneolaceae bacterium]|nr:hypothetical protein [Balneolaceae bacterium]
ESYRIGPRCPSGNQEGRRSSVEHRGSSHFEKIKSNATFSVYYSFLFTVDYSFVNLHHKETGSGNLNGIDTGG